MDNKASDNALLHIPPVMGWEALDTHLRERGNTLVLPQDSLENGSALAYHASELASLGIGTAEEASAKLAGMLRHSPRDSVYLVHDECCDGYWLYIPPYGRQQMFMRLGTDYADYPGYLHERAAMGRPDDSSHYVMLSVLDGSVRHIGYQGVSIGPDGNLAMTPVMDYDRYFALHDEAHADNRSMELSDTEIRVHMPYYVERLQTMRQRLAEVLEAASGIAAEWGYELQDLDAAQFDRVYEQLPDALQALESDALQKLERDLSNPQFTLRKAVDHYPDLDEFTIPTDEIKEKPLKFGMMYRAGLSESLADYEEKEITDVVLIPIHRLGRQLLEMDAELYSHDLSHVPHYMLYKPGHADNLGAHSCFSFSAEALSDVLGYDYLEALGIEPDDRNGYRIRQLLERISELEDENGVVSGDALSLLHLKPAEPAIGNRTERLHGMVDQARERILPLARESCRSSGPA